jgi:tetratricopeptide (TPR) repeat protein
VFAPYQPVPEYLVPNPELATRYFRTGAEAIRPGLQLFRANKAAGAFRIFVLGESSAQGFPFYNGGSFPRMLEQRLKRTFPGREIEVVNMGLTAVSSYTLLDLTGAVLQHKPDAVLIYTGHNEYYGVMGAASTRSGALTRLYMRARHLRTVQLLENVFAGIAGGLGGGADRPRTMMEIMAAGKSVPLGSGVDRRGAAQFADNLGRILAQLRQAGVPVLVGTLASNERDQAPFISAVASRTDSTAWGAHYTRATAALQRGDTAAALAALDQAVRMDDVAASARYARARILDARGRHAEARAEYLAAKDRDQLRFRAPEAFNRIIREQAARHGATVVDVQARLAAASPGGIIGNNVMMEHLHPNVEGYFLIADAFYETMRARRMIGAWDRAVPAAQARVEAPVTAVDSLSGVILTRRLTAGWPFRPTTEANYAQADQPPADKYEALAQQSVTAQLPWLEALRREGELHLQDGDVVRAARTAEALAIALPYSASAALVTSRLWERAGNVPHGQQWLSEVERRDPTPQMLVSIANALVARGDRAGAAQRYRRALSLNPGNPQLEAMAQTAERLPALERAAASGGIDAQMALAEGYVIVGQLERARELARRVLAASPGHPGATQLLARTESRPRLPPGAGIGGGL